MTGDDPVTSDLPAFWRTVLKSVRNKALNSCVLHLLCLQWVIWLATCQLKTIQEFKVRSSFYIVFPPTLFVVDMNIRRHNLLSTVLNYHLIFL